MERLGVVREAEYPLEKRLHRIWLGSTARAAALWATSTGTCPT